MRRDAEGVHLQERRAGNPRRFLWYRGAMGRGRARKLAIRLAACAVIGAVVNVAIAWMASLWAFAPLEPARKISPSTWPCAVPAAWGRGPSNIDEYTGTWVTSRDYDIDGVVGVWEARLGWPFRSLQGMTVNDDVAGVENGERVLAAGYNWSTPQSHSVSALPAPEWMQPDVNSLGAFPTQPLWPGFALNSAFYGILASVIWLSPGIARRRLRRARGRCPACGYDLKGAPAATCPECGA
jgi:hypothetical protein